MFNDANILIKRVVLEVVTQIAIINNLIRFGFVSLGIFSDCIPS